tara:strand:- start:45207 stop:46340 length:1134 start_codon:yes stop_codon:yes gene_type:complete
MAGTALAEFTDFVGITGQAIFSGPNDIINDSTEHNTYLLRKALKGKPLSAVVKGGRTIDDTIQFDNNGSFSNYQTNAVFSPSNPQLTTNISINWRFSKFEYVYTDQEIELNATDGMTEGARFHQYKEIKMQKEMGAWSSGVDGIENQLLAVPVTGDQEAAGGEDQYSIFSFISEDTTNFHPTGWTTIEGINPANEANWRNQVTTYDHTDPLNITTGVFAAFDEMKQDIYFEMPGTRDQYFENDTMNRCCIIASKQGMTLYQQALRASNDRLVGNGNSSDPSYADPAYAGIPVKRISGLDDAAVYTSAAEAAGEPRYYWLNFNYIKVVFHTNKYFQQSAPIRHPNQPFTHVVYFDTYWNMIMRSRRRQGIVAPTTPSN